MMHAATPARALALAGASVLSRAARHVCPRPAITTRPAFHRQLAPAVGCSFWNSARHLRSAPPPEVPEPLPTPPAGQEEIGFLDDTEIEDEWDAEEISQGVFVSVTPVSPATQPSPTTPNTTAPRRPPTSIKHINRLLSRHAAPDLPESELEEKFVRGRGPGGQAINKTNSSVCLVHVPTGLRVQAQPTRSREQNRQVARQILKERLDLMRARGELDGVDTAMAAGTNAGTTQGAAEQPASRKQKLAAEARQWSKQELRWEKERRRKLNRAKKVKKRGRKDDEDGE